MKITLIWQLLAFLSQSSFAVPVADNHVRYTCQRASFRDMTDLDQKSAFPTIREFPLWHIANEREHIRCDAGKVAPLRHRQELCNCNGTVLGQTRDLPCVTATSHHNDHKAVRHDDSKKK